MDKKAPLSTLATEIYEKATAAELEAKIQSELRTIALERLEAKNKGLELSN